MVPVMAFYILLPCVSQAETVKSPFLNNTQSVHSVQQSAIPPTGTITYFYSGSTLMNAEDDNGDMSTYLDRTVRTIVDVNTKTVLDTQCIFTDGKNAISQTDSTGTTVTSTQQYNPYGQPVSYTSSTNKQINKLTNQQLNILTNPFAYDGYYYDPESGLYYLNARYYSPALMQFISMDTYDLTNRYGYCDGNPIGNEDPTGHDPIPFLSFLKEVLNPIEKGANVEDIAMDILNSACDLGSLLPGGAELKLADVMIDQDLNLIKYADNSTEYDMGIFNKKINFYKPPNKLMIKEQYAKEQWIARDTAGFKKNKELNQNNSFLMSNENDFKEKTIYKFVIGRDKDNNIFARAIENDLEKGYRAHPTLVHNEEPDFIYTSPDDIKNNDVLFAGLIKRVNHETIAVTNFSGHYQPSLEQMTKLKEKKILDGLLGGKKAMYLPKNYFDNIDQFNL